MVILKPKKYIYSLMDEEPITELIACDCGEVIVRTESKDRRFRTMEDTEGTTADYILCTLQDEPSLKLSKYPLAIHLKDDDDDDLNENQKLGQSTII